MKYGPFLHNAQEIILLIFIFAFSYIYDSVMLWSIAIVLMLTLSDEISWQKYVMASDLKCNVQ